MTSEELPSPVCSAKGCQAPAVWVLAWNNPKIHTPDRRKTWLACDEHREHLSAFLGVRGFLKDVVPLRTWESQQEQQEPAPGGNGVGGSAPGGDTPGGSPQDGSPSAG